MNKITTIEHLTEQISPCYGAILKYEGFVFVTDLNWKGHYTASIYELLETPEETGLGDIECRISCIAEAEEKFKDSGHAIEWCLKKVKDGI